MLIHSSIHTYICAWLRTGLLKMRSGQRHGLYFSKDYVHKKDNKKMKIWKTLSWYLKTTTTTQRHAEIGVRNLG